MGSKKAFLIGDLCDFIKGASVPRDRMLDNGDWLYIHYGDLYKGYNLYINAKDSSSKIPYILSKEKIKPEQFLKNEDIVYVLTSETVEDLGKAFLLRSTEDQKVVSGTETTIMRIKRKDIVNPRYLNYLLQTQHFKKVLQQYVTGMKVFRVHPRDISKIEIEVPALKDQKKIVNLLDAMHNKIKINSKINDYLEELAISIYVEKLEWKQGCLPDGWELRTLSSFFPVTTGKKDANIASDNGKYPFFTCKQNSLLADVYSFDGSAILVAGNGDFNVKWYEGKFEAYQRTYVLIPDNPALLGYLYCAVKRNLSEITSGSRGSVIKFITKGNIADYKIAVPPDLGQNDTVKQLRFILGLIDTYKNEIKKLDKLKDTLLPKLMSGEIDVSKIDIK